MTDEIDRLLSEALDQLGLSILADADRSAEPPPGDIIEAIRAVRRARELRRH